MLKFNDGIEIDTSGPMRTMKLKDGWYAVGEGFLIPCESKEKAQEFVQGKPEEEDEDDSNSL